MQDPYTVKMVRWAHKEAQGSKFGQSETISAFVNGTYSDACFEAALVSLRTHSLIPSAERALCCWLLGEAALRPEHHATAAESLCCLLRQWAVRAPARPSRALRFAMLMGMPIVLVCGCSTAGPIESDVLLWVASSLGVGIAFAIPLVLLLWWAFTFAPTSADHQRFQASRCLAANALGNLRIPETVPLLAQLCLTAQGYPGPVPERALMAALPALTSRHYGSLGAKTVPLLCRLLSDRLPVIEIEGPAVEFCGALMTALEKIGDGSAVPAVRQIARQSGCRRLADQAKSVLIALEARQRKERECETLVRGASAPAANSRDLLRPGGAVYDAPDMLLRSVIDIRSERTSSDNAPPF